MFLPGQPVQWHLHPQRVNSLLPTVTSGASLLGFCAWHVSLLWPFRDVVTCSAVSYKEFSCVLQTDSHTDGTTPVNKEKDIAVRITLHRQLD